MLWNNLKSQLHWIFWTVKLLNWFCIGFFSIFIHHGYIRKKNYFDKDLDELRFVLNQMASYAYCDRTQNLGLSLHMHVLETLAFKHTHDIRP